MTHERRWRPLHVAIAWVVTRDEEFCREIADDRFAEQYTVFGIARLEQAMMQAGCFNTIKETMSLKPGYVGRFHSLAEDYENGGKSTFTLAIKAVPNASEAASGIICLSDFLSGRWGEAFRSIADRIADGDIRARGVAIDGEERLPSGDMPPASVTNAMSMDHKYTVWEGPQAIGGKQSRRWIGITLEWKGVLKCFPKPRAPTEKKKSELPQSRLLRLLAAKGFSSCRKRSEWRRSSNGCTPTTTGCP